MKWLHELALTEEASAVRAQLSVAELQHIERAIEHLSLVTDRQVVELANELLVGVREMVDGDGSRRFLGIIEDIIAERDR